MFILYIYIFIFWFFFFFSIARCSRRFSVLCVPAYPDACYPVRMDGGVGVAGEGVCPACRLPFDSGKKRRLIDSCGHERCYSCMFSSEVCPLCVAGGEYTSLQFASVPFCPFHSSSLWTVPSTSLPVFSIMGIAQTSILLLCFLYVLFESYIGTRKLKNNRFRKDRINIYASLNATHKWEYSYVHIYDGKMANYCLKSKFSSEQGGW